MADYSLWDDDNYLSDDDSEDEYIPPEKVKKTVSVFNGKRHDCSKSSSLETTIAQVPMALRQSTSEEYTNDSIIDVNETTIDEDPNDSITAASLGQNEMKKNPNPLWNYFTKSTDNKAKCKICSTNLKQGRTKTTSSLIKHLMKHKAYLKYRAEKEVLMKKVNEFKDRQVSTKKGNLF